MSAGSQTKKGTSAVLRGVLGALYSGSTCVAWQLPLDKGGLQPISDLMTHSATPLNLTLIGQVN